MASNSQITSFVILLAIAFALEVVALGFPASALKFVLSLIAVIFAVLAFSMRYYSYIFIPLLHAKNKNIVLSEYEPFILAPSGNAITTHSESFVYATAYVRIPVYSSSTEMEDEEKQDFSTLFSRVVSLSKSPIKISTQMSVLNKDDYINKVKDKLNDAENRYQVITTDKTAKPEDVERIKGEVTMWHNLLDNITKLQSLAAISYIGVTAMGGNDEEAINMALQKANELAAGIGAIYGVVADIISSPEIFLLIEPEYIIPFSTVNSQINENTMKQAL